MYNFLVGVEAVRVQPLFFAVSVVMVQVGAKYAAVTLKDMPLPQRHLLLCFTAAVGLSQPQSFSSVLEIIKEIYVVSVMYVTKIWK